MLGECIESGETGWGMSGECIESGQSRLANVGECIKSDLFSKMAILASTRICQNWRIFGKYSNSTNSPASGHCLDLVQNAKFFFGCSKVLFS